MSGALWTLTHLVAAAQFVFSSYYFFYVMAIPKTDDYRMFHSFGGGFRFLTIWNLVAQSLFFIICVLNDLIGSNELFPRKAPWIRRFKDFYFTSIVFPIGCFVAISFWGIYAVDRELVFPKSLDPYFPTWLNHIMHTNVVIFPLIEMTCAFRVYPSRKKGLTTLVTFMFCYLVWTVIMFLVAGHWVYPVLDVLDWPQRIIFIVSMLFFAVGLYFVGAGLNRMIWGSNLKGTEMKSKAGKKKIQKQT